MIRILLAEDQQMLQGALASLINLEDDLEVVAKVERGDEVLPAAVAACPDVAILDIQMPGMSGLDAARTLTQELPECRILILTTFGRPGYLQQAMEAGVSGFLLKDARVEELTDAIRKITRGERVIDIGLAASALSSGASPLTPREEDVLEHARTGATVAEIGDATYLSQGTVRNYLSSAMTKLGARTRTEAARIAEEKGWLQPP
ncbi:MAG: response regulator transcription factor [Actinobacteria bacterium]|nr:response regulator transcription factor [Actinomycetota bacterium]MCL6104447.1 response regulator transcription factor [Actinomycetota bacterium]